MSNQTRTAFFISGTGTTVEAVIKASKKNKLGGIIPTLVLSSNKNASGLEKAKALGVPTVLVEKNDFKTSEQFGEAILQICNGFSIELISNNGWIPYTPKNVIDAYRGRIINQHPGPLDPGRGTDFGGKGMYGIRVIAARMIYEWLTDANSPWTEATIHFVTETLDEGDLIRTKKVTVPKPKQKITIDDIRNNTTIQQYIHDTVIDFQKHFLPIEHQNVIESLQLFATGKKPKGYQRETPLITPGNKNLLDESKRLAIQFFQ